MKTQIQTTMDIQSPKGSKVKFTGENGYNHDLFFAKTHLTVGEIYTVEKTVIDSWSTVVYLQEIPAHAFNSVHFVNVDM